MQTFNSQAPTFQIGGTAVNLASLPNLITLAAYVTITNYACTPRQIGGGAAGYTPSGAKNFRVIAIRINYSVDAAAQQGCAFAYGNNDIGYPSGTAVTSPKWLSGAGSTAATSSSYFENIKGTYTYSVNWLVPNGKYLYCDNGSIASAKIELFGFEE